MQQAYGAYMAYNQELARAGILVGGASGGQAFVARLMPNGTIDPSFDASGIPGMSAVTAAAITENGDRIVLVGLRLPSRAKLGARPPRNS